MEWLAPHHTTSALGYLLEDRMSEKNIKVNRIGIALITIVVIVAGLLQLFGCEAVQVF